MERIQKGKCKIVRNALENYIESQFVLLQKEAEEAASFDDLMQVAHRISNIKLTFSEKTLELFWQEKTKLLKLVEEKFGGKIKLRLGV